ncbi:MAG: ArnT family glycosyltransferase [Thermodesulfobacteriaceae bacterium]|jgi:4-amino-4-deoxy-L-arabinose transferase-like glycosyltransferase
MGEGSKKGFLDFLVSREGFFLWLYSTFLILYLGELNLPLSYDEAYYWDWSRALDFGYYSKPPMVAWIIRLTTSLFGDTEFGVRVGAVLFRVFSLLFAMYFFYRYFDRLRVRLILFTLCFTPILTIYSFIMTIDPPLFFFWIASLFFGAYFLEKRNTLSAFYLGLSIGLGLLTKQTMLAFLALFLFYLLLFERDLLKTKQTLILIGVSFILILPNILWNLNHGLVMIKHTGESFSRLFPPLKEVGKFLSGVFFLYGPLLLPLFFYLSFRYAKVLGRFFRRENLPIPDDKLFQFKLINLLFILSFLPLLGLIPLSLILQMNVNWVAPFFLSAYFFTLALAISRQLYLRLVILNLIICFFLSLAILVLPKKPDLFGPEVARSLFKFYGGRELAEAVEKYYRKDIPLLTSGRESASWLAFYLKDKPKVYVVKKGSKAKNQYHIWRDAETLRGKEVLLVKKWTDKPTYLESPIHLETVQYEFYGKRGVYSIWRGVYVGVER